MNTKVKRVFEAMAVVLKDENPRLIKKLDNVINDRYAERSGDGYPYNFESACGGFKRLVKGKSW